MSLLLKRIIIFGNYTKISVFLRKWKRELNSAMVKKKRHKLLNAFLGLFGKKLTLLSILYCIDGWILA